MKRLQSVDVLLEDSGGTGIKTVMGQYLGRRGAESLQRDKLPARKT